jgi:hypothetical protein
MVDGKKNCTSLNTIAEDNWCNTGCSIMLGSRVLYCRIVGILVDKDNNVINYYDQLLIISVIDC